MFTRSTIKVQDILRGYARINYQVDGYWSRETITIYVDRRMDWETKKAIWVANVNHSTGGRDTEQVADDNQATRNFATALMDAAYQADLIMAQSEGLELAYRASQKAQELKELYAEAEFQAKLEQDLPIGMDMATKIIDDLRNEVKVGLEKDPWLCQSKRITLRSRVTNYENEICAYTTNSANPKIRFRVNGESVGIIWAKEFVANMSANNSMAAKLVA